jgi:hypothetical protein
MNSQGRSVAPLGQAHHTWFVERRVDNYPGETPEES